MTNLGGGHSRLHRTAEFTKLPASAQRNPQPCPCKWSMAPQLQCTFGAAPSNLVVLPTNREQVANQFAANIMDHVPMVNIMPFGVCASLANPATAAATSAALGVAHPDTLRARDTRTMGARLADGAARQSACAEQSVEVHVYVCGCHLDPDARSDDDPNSLIRRRFIGWVEGACWLPAPSGRPCCYLWRRDRQHEQTRLSLPNNT